MGNIRAANSKPRKQTVSQLGTGNVATPDVERLPWAWLLVIAPGRLITFISPHPINEVAQRLHVQSTHVKSIGTRQVVISLPGTRTERRFFGWLESDPRGGTRLSGQTRTPYRTAATRLGIGVVMCGLALMFLAGAHGWLAFMFVSGGLGFMLLSQYERLTRRDVRLFTAWLRQIIDAERPN